MMLMMDDAVVGEKAESVEKEYSALAREIEFRLTPYLYQLGIPPHVTGYSYLRSAVVEFLLNPRFRRISARPRKRGHKLHIGQHEKSLEIGRAHV